VPAVGPHGLVLEGNGAVLLLLLHGLTGAPAELGYVAHYLHRRAGFSVQCPRLVNHDQSIGVLATTTHQALYDDAEEHWRHAVGTARAAGQRLVVGGLSLGALLALQLAAAHADDVAGVVALSPTFVYDGWAVPWIHRLIPLATHLPLRHVLFLREDAPYGLKDPVLRERIGAAYRRASLHDDAAAARECGYSHFPVALFCEMRRIIADCSAVLPDVAAPLLIVQAREDEVTSVRNAELLREKAGSRHKEIMLLENSYHVVTADLERSRVAAEIARFCNAIAHGACPQNERAACTHE
jgi:carboxylesterase